MASKAFVVCTHSFTVLGEEVQEQVRQGQSRKRGRRLRAPCRTLNNCRAPAAGPRDASGTCTRCPLFFHRTFPLDCGGPTRPMRRDRRPSCRVPPQPELFRCTSPGPAEIRTGNERCRTDSLFRREHPGAGYPIRRSSSIWDPSIGSHRSDPVLWPPTISPPRISCFIDRAADRASLFDTRDPASLKTRTPQAADDVWAVSHQPPQQSRMIILYHQDRRSFIQPEMPRPYPAVGITGCGGAGRIKGRLEAVAVGFRQFDVMNTVIERGKHNLGREWQRRRHGPRRDRAVVGSVRHAAPHVTEEPALDAGYVDGVRTGTFARGQSPAMPAIVRELERVVDRVLTLYIGRASAVLEIVDALGTHEGILNTAKVDPDMGELVRE